MFFRLKHIGTTARLALFLILLVMLPAIFFSAYEFSTLSRSEALIGDVYRQQLDVVLFSLNQYAWDVANSWANTINDDLSTAAAARQDPGMVLAPFLAENTGIRCVFLADSAVKSVQLIFPNTRTDGGNTLTVGHVATGLKNSYALVERLFRYNATGYRKIDHMRVGQESGPTDLALVFVAGERGREPRIVGVVIDAERFIRDVLGRKMGEAAGDNFLLTVNRKSSNQVVFSTGEVLPGEASQTRDLWAFPDYTIGIRLRGQTIDEVVRGRFYGNLLLIGLLNVVLIAGVWVVYRTVRREVELAQLKSDFVSNVSHEIKTPLALIRMFSETLQLKRVKSEAKKQEYYDTIVQETERLTHLINNILNFSRMEAGRKEYRMEPVELNTVVLDVLKNYRPHLEREGFTVSTALTDSLPFIEADSGALAEALLNIIDNSVKYSRAEKHLIVVTGSDRKTVFVEVEDHGIGIEPRQQQKIFEKFYRVSSGLVSSTKGTGLGLALVKHIVDAHKGTITLRSQVGKGSAFRLSFPASRNQKSGS